MDARNPYAVSTASFQQRDDVAAGSQTSNVWRDGKLLVMRPDAALPHRCVKCNEPCDPPKKPFRVHWHHWSVYLLLFIFVALYVAVGLLVRRKAAISAGLCRKHRQRRTAAFILMWLGIVGGVAAMTTALSVMGLVIALASLFIGLATTRVISAKHISEEYVRLRGCGPEFLDALPPFRA